MYIQYVLEKRLVTLIRQFSTDVDDKIKKNENQEYKKIIHGPTKF